MRIAWEQRLQRVCLGLDGIVPRSCCPTMPRGQGSLVLRRWRWAEKAAGRDAGATVLTNLCQSRPTCVSPMAAGDVALSRELRFGGSEEEPARPPASLALRKEGKKIVLSFFIVVCLDFFFFLEVSSFDAVS